MRSGEIPKIVVEDADLKLRLEQEELYFTKNEQEAEVGEEEDSTPWIKGRRVDNRNGSAAVRIPSVRARLP